MLGYIQKQSDILAKKVLESQYAPWLLGVVSFLESSIIPIFIDPLIALLVLANPRKWISVGMIASITSVLGGVAGYVVGAFFFATIGAPIVAMYGLEDAFGDTIALYEKSAFLVILFGAFTPIPYKIFALGAGVAEVSLVLFILASFIGRTARFMLVAFLVSFFGVDVLSRFSRYLGRVTLAVIVLLILYFLYTFLH